MYKLNGMFSNLFSPHVFGFKVLGLLNEIGFFIKEKEFNLLLNRLGV